MSLQPCPYPEGPRSHSSPVSLMLFPHMLSLIQISFEDELPPVQVYPVSTWQVELQPSLESVLLSSHPSGNILSPSPQIV